MGLHYILQGLNLNIFEELKSCVHDMELSMTIREEQYLPTCEARKVKDIEKLHSGGKYTSTDKLKSLCILTLLNAGI